MQHGSAREKAILLAKAMTGPENILNGSTLREGQSSDEIFSFQGSKGRSPITLDEANKVRKEAGWVRLPLMEAGFHAVGILPRNKNYAIPLGELGPDGQAEGNPQVLVGVWKEANGELTQVEGDITMQVRELLRIDGIEVPWKESEGHPEFEKGGKVEG